MVSRLIETVAALAAAVTRTDTPELRAAGVHSDRGTAPGIRFRWELRCWDCGPHDAGTVTARDFRAALRAVAREMRQDARSGGRRFPCGPDGPAVSVSERTRAAGPAVEAEAIGPDGVSCGILRITREDGRPIRKGARRGGH